MTRAEVNAFIKSGVDSLRPAVQYGRGRLTEFKSWATRETVGYPVAWLETVEGEGVETDIVGAQQLPMDAWPIRLHIAKLTTQDASPEEYEAIVDQCDAIAQTLVFKYNQIVTGYKLVTLGTITRPPFVKRHPDLAAGVVLTFDLNGPDTTDQTDNCV